MTDLFNQPEFVVHKRETTTHSETYLEANRERLSKNCQTLYNAFMEGQRITSDNSPVGDFRRRVCDLKENGVRLSFETNGRYKTWFMGDEDKTFNKLLMK